jgi:S1-C subfamily serine protease
MTSVTQYGGQYFGPQEPDGQQRRGDELFRDRARDDAQPWDPAYPHPYPYPYGYAPAPLPAGPQQPPSGPKPRMSWRRRGLIGAGMATILGAGVIIGAVAASPGQTTNGTALADGSSGTANGGGNANPGTLPTAPGGRSGNGSNNGSNGTGSPATGSATDAQQVGVVDIYTVQKYNGAAAAGTGMVISPGGEVLTNNHVIRGATSIRVTVVATGASYQARLVGTAPTKDIAVLQLSGASGLSVANLGDSSGVKVHDTVIGVGNAGGVGGTPSAARGTVLAVNKTISASDEGGLNAEKLHNMIITNAPIRSGDSGGPLYNTQDEVVGVDTAASTKGASRGFAIPINRAVSIAGQIEKGIETSSIHIGYPGFLGISLADGVTGSGAPVAGVLSGGAAAKAGIRGGDVITAVDGNAIRSGTQLQKTISSKQPGAKVSVTYAEPGNGQHTVTVTLGTGPAD